MTDTAAHADSTARQTGPAGAPDRWFAPDTAADSSSNADLSFEAAIEAAEQNIERIRSGQVSVDDLAAEAARARTLLDACEQRLAAAEQATAHHADALQ